MNKLKSRKKLNHYLDLNLKKIWEITFFSSLTIFLATLLLTEGWEPIKKSQINIKGAKNIPEEVIHESMGIEFPTSIFETNPKQLERNLKESLAVKSVSVSRKIAPLGIDIRIQERDPIAYAFRRSKNGKEKGMVDKKGYWIPIYIPNSSHNSLEEVIIDGWTKRNQQLITFILKNKKALNMKLQRIIFSPNGNITLQTDEFLFINLGNRVSVLQQQLEAISQLAKSLPDEFTKGSETTLDLTNPSKPKLYLPNSKVLTY